MKTLEQEAKGHSERYLRGDELDDQICGVAMVSFEAGANSNFIKQLLRDCWEAAHQAGRFEGKGIAEENWQTFESWYEEQQLKKT